jgi:two-component system, OmpR family, sensor histidine kinase CpxA
MTLAAISNSLSAGGFFFEIKTWGAVAAGVILLSVLFWLPLIRGITRSIRQMQQATEQIAEGRFEVRVDEHRRDELGSLGQAINRMAGRLAGFVTGQKRFLGDIAHELCSPLARMQMAIGILEQRADEKQKTALDDVREEVEQMSALVNELLSFSRASLAGHHVQLKRVRLADIVDKAIRRESARSDLIECAIPADLEVQADPDLLQRAVANLLRNALRYAGEAGPITVSAMANAGGVELKVADCGPGIPPEAMDKIFDPFFRPDPSRDRQTGGVGLGLAIVKTCVEACGAQVMCRNRQPSGLEVEIHFPPDATAATGSR